MISISKNLSLQKNMKSCKHGLTRLYEVEEDSQNLRMCIFEWPKRSLEKPCFQVRSATQVMKSLPEKSKTATLQEIKARNRIQVPRSISPLTL